MPHKAFLHKKSLLDQFKDDHKHTGIIQSMRAEHTWNNPLTRRKRTKKLNGWIKSFDGKNHIRKLSRFNAVQAHRHESLDDTMNFKGESVMQNEAMSLKGFIENLTYKLINKYGIEKDVVKNYLDLHTEEMQELLDDKELSLKEKVMFVRSEITGEKDEAENKKSESAPESDYIQEFRSWLDAQEGEPYNEQEITDFGWEWKSQDVGYPNGNKMYYDYFSIEDDGVTYRLEVAWNSFNETIVGNKIWQDSSESKKSESIEYDCKRNAHDILNYIKKATGYKNSYLVRVSVNDDEDDFYIKYNLRTNGNNYILYAGVTDYSITDLKGENTYVEGSTDLSGAMTRDLDAFCEQIKNPKNESKKNEVRILPNPTIIYKGPIEDAKKACNYVSKILANKGLGWGRVAWQAPKDGEYHYGHPEKDVYTVILRGSNNLIKDSFAVYKDVFGNDFWNNCDASPDGWVNPQDIAIRDVATESKNADEKLSYEKGHKNSKGEDAPWVIRSHEDNRILASFANKKDAKEHLQRMKQYSKSESYELTSKEIQVRKPNGTWQRWTVTWPEYVDTHIQDAKDQGWTEVRVVDIKRNENTEEHKKSEEKDRLAGYKPYSFKVTSKDPAVLKNDAEAVLTEFAADVADNTSFKFDYDWYDKSWELTDTKTNQVFRKGTFLFKDFAKSPLYLDDGVLATPAGMKLRTWIAVSDVDESKKSEGLSNEKVKDAVKFAATEAGLENYLKVDSDGAMSVTVSLPINSDDLKTVRWVINSNDGTITEYLDTEKNLIRDFTDDESLVSMLTLLFQTSRMSLRDWFQKKSEALFNKQELEAPVKSYISDVLSDLVVSFHWGEDGAERLVDKYNDVIMTNYMDGDLSAYETAKYINGKENPNPVESKKKQESKKNEGHLTLVDTIVVPKWLWDAFYFADEYGETLNEEEEEILADFKAKYADAKYHLETPEEEADFRSRNDFDNYGGPCYDINVYEWK